MRFEKQNMLLFKTFISKNKGETFSATAPLLCDKSSSEAFESASRVEIKKPVSEGVSFLGHSCAHHDMLRNQVHAG